LPQLPSSTVLPADEDSWIAVGVIRGAFGVQGALKVEPYTATESTVLNHVRRWRLRASGSGGPMQASVKPGRQMPFDLPAEVSVESCKPHTGFIIATIAPAITREQAMALKGIEVLVGRSDFPQAEPDEYYWADLIGCAVRNPAGEDLGIVEAVDDHGAQSVLRLNNGLLIPFVAAFIVEVAPAEKRITADWSADWA
jgi:16S rRNA processing protein RimM